MGSRQVDSPYFKQILKCLSCWRKDHSKDIYHQLFVPLIVWCCVLARHFQTSKSSSGLQPSQSRDWILSGREYFLNKSLDFKFSFLVMKISTLCCVATFAEACLQHKSFEGFRNLLRNVLYMWRPFLKINVAPVRVSIASPPSRCCFWTRRTRSGWWFTSLTWWCLPTTTPSSC